MHAPQTIFDEVGSSRRTSKEGPLSTKIVSSKEFDAIEVSSFGQISQKRLVITLVTQIIHRNRGYKMEKKHKFNNCEQARTCCKSAPSVLSPIRFISSCKLFLRVIKDESSINKASGSSAMLTAIAEIAQIKYLFLKLECFMEIFEKTVLDEVQFLGTFFKRKTLHTPQDTFSYIYTPSSLTFVPISHQRSSTCPVVDLVFTHFPFSSSSPRSWSSPFDFFFLHPLLSLKDVIPFLTTQTYTYTWQ